MAATLRWLAVLLSPFLFEASAKGFVVPFGPSLPDVIKQSDVIIKGIVQSAEPSGINLDPNVDITEFKVISVIKGAIHGGVLKFRHNQGPGLMLWNQCYQFEKGKTYLICAKRSETADVFQQLWSNLTETDDSVFRCLNDKPVTFATYPQALCAEMIGRLQGPDTKDVMALIGQLDRRSNGLGLPRAPSDFDRTQVLAGVHGLMSNANPEIAQAAIRLVGSFSPYVSEENARQWLNAHGSVKLPNFGVLDLQMKNRGGETYRDELLAIANGNRTAETRALAISALGLVKGVPFEPLEHWLSDPAPAVRRSALLLLSDFPTLITSNRLHALAADPAPEVRAALAITIGLRQQPDDVDLLGKLLSDHDARVRQSAAMSLLTFSPKDKNVAAILNKSRNREEFVPLFLNAVALDHPEPYLDRLALVVEHKTAPTNWWGGETPYLVAWEILFEHLQNQPVDVIKSGKLDRYLDVMENVAYAPTSDQECDATHGVHHNESPAMADLKDRCQVLNVAVPVAIYTFYLQRGMNSRAAKYRQAETKRWLETTPKAFLSGMTLMPEVFARVEKNPALYTRN